MAIKEVDSASLKTMLTAGAAVLDKNLTRINDLNVFPVPDGDTGTNMEFTIKGAVNGACGCNGNLSETAKAMAKGALLGARGNSGVILSQFLKGIAVGLEGLEKADTVQFANAFKKGVEYAYKSVLYPTEGTILTVMREATEFAASKIPEHGSLSAFIADFLEQAKISLAHTPELLDVLKKSGVVDSGAAGLICVAEGFQKAINEEDFEISDSVEDNKQSSNLHTNAFGPDSVLEYGYCTEFILQLMNAKTDIKSFKINTITDYLQTVGNSIVAILDEDVVKIHVHTKTPAKVIDFCQRFGEFVTFKMENMSVQHNEIIANEEAAITSDEPVKMVKNAVVAVASGEGISEVFRSLGSSAIVNGGQTMNPSSSDFINAFDTLNAENIIVLPNNSNIIMAAKQAAELYDKANVYVINSHTVAEGYSSMTVTDIEADIEEIILDMERACSHVETLFVTYAVRNGSMDGVEYEKDDYISVCGKKMMFSAKDKTKAVINGIKALNDCDDREIVTVFYGADVSEEEKASFLSEFNKSFSDKELYEIDGGQDVYSFIVALE